MPSPPIPALSSHVRYQCPRSGEIFDFLTNERTIPPGLLARIYQMRWDIEPERSGDSWPSYFEISQQKTYDEFKNKLNENKAWVSSPTAKAMQAWFICLAHNLMVLQEHLLRTGEGVTNTIGVPALQKILK